MDGGRLPLKFLSFHIELYFQGCYYMPGNLSVQWLVLLGILKQLGKRVCVFVRCLQLLYLVVYFCGKGLSETAVQITKECRIEAVIYATSSHILYWFCTRQASLTEICLSGCSGSHCVAVCAMNWIYCSLIGVLAWGKYCAHYPPTDTTT